MRQAGRGPYADRTHPWADRNPVARRTADQRSARPHGVRSGSEDRVGAGPRREGRGKRRTVGMDDWAWERVGRWTEHRIQLPIGLLFSVAGPTRGRGWSARTKGSRCRSPAYPTCPPRDHVYLPPRHRHARDRGHGPPPPATGDPSERRPATWQGAVRASRARQATVRSPTDAGRAVNAGTVDGGCGAFLLAPQSVRISTSRREYRRERRTAAPGCANGAARRRVVGRHPKSAWQRRRSVSRCGLGAGRAWASAPLVGASGRRRRGRGAAASRFGR